MKAYVWPNLKKGIFNPKICPCLYVLNNFILYPSFNAKLINFI